MEKPIKHVHCPGAFIPKLQNIAIKYLYLTEQACLASGEKVPSHA